MSNVSDFLYLVEVVGDEPYLPSREEHRAAAELGVQWNEQAWNVYCKTVDKVVEEHGKDYSRDQFGFYWDRQIVWRAKWDRDNANPYNWLNRRDNHWSEAFRQVFHWKSMLTAKERKLHGI